MLALWLLQAASADVATGVTAPAIQLTDAQGGAFDLAGLRGRVVVVDFWASWCAGCLQELPALDAMHRRIEGSGATVVAVNLDRVPEVGAAVVRRLGLTLPLLYDWKGDAVSRWNPTSLPALYVLDRDGVVRDTHVGTLDARGLAAIEALVLALAP